MGQQPADDLGMAILARPNEGRDPVARARLVDFDTGVSQQPADDLDMAVLARPNEVADDLDTASLAPPNEGRDPIAHERLVDIVMLSRFLHGGQLCVRPRRLTAVRLAASSLVAARLASACVSRACVSFVSCVSRHSLKRMIITHSRSREGYDLPQSPRKAGRSRVSESC